MKKLICILLLILIVSVFDCASSGGEKTKDDNSSVSAEKQSLPKDGYYNVRFNSLEELANFNHDSLPPDVSNKE